ncbi:putative MATE family efflux protein [Clostridium tetanomorphum]|uniref:Multidrug export protein MepA n=1 Tax=Clostridium tetanomorphum TaxID=1553 RepID=A0A923IZ28_CLOTT|nr:MATE family efflux transporter [Clostridium tetanomorphum]KAJ50253.1 Na+ driven multidrug efflux pump [Clostridium tetanomorphum DSM 665]MBC2396189.1 MATE family efflux transporter [Clostridium tetanomorphum]MBP1864394.1 putative MATE family efflux protein [Clostridium tetanomorphum]NRS83840.1 putative MATE family efflux protein [Clostridium tetanomorphum]NRZ97027.1 putative MATE family efflux protein [Clostridium tetanomorphum]
MDSRSRIKLISEGKISTALLKLGVPMIISMLVTALYNVVDAYFVGGLGTSAIAAVSVAFPISIVFSGVGLTFGSGGGSYISRLLGAENREGASRVASTSLISAVFIGIILAAIILGFLDSTLIFMGATETILPYAKSYAIIFIMASIINTFNVAMGNLAVSQGASNISLNAMLAGAILNMILDPIFIYTLAMGIKGAAIATLISQCITTLIYVWYILGGKSYVKIAFSYFTLDKNIYAEVFKIGISMLILQLLTSISMGLINKIASNYGDAAVAAMGIVTRVTALGTYVVFGYVKGFQPIAGYNYGAKSYKRLNEAISVSLKWTTPFCAIWTIIVFIFSKQIVSIFSSDTNVISIAEKALRAYSIMFISFGFQFVYSTLFLSLGKAKKGGILTMGRQGIFFIPVILTLPSIMGLNGVIYTQAIADLLTTILTFIFAYNIKNEINTLIEDNNIVKA